MSTRLFAMAALMLLATACGGDPGKSGTVTEAANAGEDGESGQERALEAGRALIGKMAPAAVLRTIDGETVDLAQAYGRKPVYLKFWATWCIPCRQQMPGFEADFQKYRDRILTVAVNTGFNDDEVAVREYRQRLGISMPIAIDDGSLGQALNLRVTPQHVVIGRSGRILYVGHEENAGLRRALEQAVAELPAPTAASAGLRRDAFGVGDVPGTVDAGLDARAGFATTGPSKDARPRLLFFFSPWCESYLKESRPEQAKACRRVRMEVNELAQSGQFRLVGISSGLWSSTKDLDEYRASKALKFPLYLDANGRLFRSFGVQNIPTMIEIDSSGRVVRRIGPNDKSLNAAARAAKAVS